MMDSEDDDIYPAYDPSYDQSNERGAIKTEPDAEEEGEDAEDDSDEDINFITDVKEEPKPDLKSQTKRPSSTGRTTSEQPKISDSPQRRRASQSQSHDIKAEPQSPQDDKPGTEYPGRHTSKIDVNANPVHPGTGKPILSTDFDSDFPTESTKPWRKPGADITDYFNYGFDEFTWASYCLKQQQMPKQVKEINQEAEQMKAFVEGIPGGGGMPGMPGAPTGPGGGMPGGGAPGGMPGMPGMPSEAEMQQMFSTMMAQGMDPNQMDQNQFMQMMMGGAGNMMGGNQPPSGPGGGFGGGVGGGGFDQGPMYGDGGGRGRGRGRRGRGW